jgi:tRNA (cmo5U34)-methyltransferase
MNTRLNGFDRIAWFYDPLARLVFGNRLKHAQKTYLHHLKTGSRVLILGGGTGAILEAVLYRQPECHITYIDASMAMLKRAQGRRLNGSISYIHGDENSIPESNYDAVITPFYLDMFTEHDLAAAIRKISASMAPGALWIVADFFPSQRMLHRALLSLMYAFFRATTGIRARSLPDWKSALELNGWVESKSQTDGFIGSAIFRQKS